MNETKKEKPKGPREYLPSIKSFSEAPKPSHDKGARRTHKKRGRNKLGKKLWKEYYESIEFIKHL